jgi:predicted alpha/beta hydrolase family esterase
MRGWLTIWACAAMVSMSLPAAAKSGRSVEIPINDAGDVAVAEIVARLAQASDVAIKPPPAGLTLSTRGLSRALTRTLLIEALGPEVEVAFRPGAMVLEVDDRVLAPARRAEWAGRLRGLSDRAVEAARRRESYGMHARPSYRPNDPARPTVCLVHGLNSSSGGFVHMIPWIEEAGYGVVFYDYPYNRPIAESCAAFARDWVAFRKRAGEHRPWAILAHSMGALLARSLIEDDATWAGDVSSLIMIAPVNGGSQLARMQTVLQLIDGLQSIRSKKTSRAMAHLSEGTGQAAQDMLPGSPLLAELNRRPRRRGLAYHIVAGDVGFLTREDRARIEARVDLVHRNAGIFGRLAQVATADLPELLDELTDGTGDGCVTVDRTRLDGVPDHVVLHANHAELIRAPLLFRDPGPVACMPDVLRWLAADLPRPAPRSAK